MPAKKDAAKKSTRPSNLNAALARPAKSPATSKDTFNSKRDLAPARVAEILKRLAATYPNALCALTHRNAWELLAATILSAQCTDVRVNMVTPTLFERFPTIDDMAAAPLEEVVEIVRSTGFYNNKAKNLIGAAQVLKNNFNGQVPQTLEELLTVPGAARKTANVVLGSFYGIASGVVVDTHVQRISQRLDFTREEEPVKIEQDLMAIVPQQRWISFSHQIIHHGRALCVARKPRCAECAINPLCY